MFRDVDDTGPKKFLIPWSDSSADGNTTFKLQVVEVNTLENMNRMEGSHAKIRYNQSSDKVAPDAHFIQRSDGVYVATDPISFQMVSVYAHMEKLGEMEDRFGLGGIVPRPRFVSVESSIINDRGVEEQDNGAYFGDRDIIGIVKTASTIPVSFNGGIIAHEHFHAIFQHLVIKNLLITGKARSYEFLEEEQKTDGQAKRGESQDQESQPQVIDETKRDPKYFNRIILSALNEGLADYWGWLYSRDPSFLMRTRSTEIQRSVVPTRFALPNKSNFLRKSKDSPARFAAARSYELGTRFAGLMRAWTEQEGEAATVKLLVSALKKIPQKWPQISSESIVSPNILLGLLLDGENTLSPERCCLASSFLAPEFDNYEIKQTCQAKGFSCPAE